MDAEPAFDMLEAILEPLCRCLDAESARRVIAFRVAPEVEQRVEVLADRANEGLLTNEEREEYETAISTTEFIMLLQRVVERNLRSNAA